MILIIRTVRVLGSFGGSCLTSLQAEERDTKIEDLGETNNVANKLATWNVMVNLCSWYDVSCLQNRVSHLVLEGLDLQGSLQPLTSLTQLRILSLKRNRLSGPILNLFNLIALKLLLLTMSYRGSFPLPSHLFSGCNVSIFLTTTYLGQISASINHLAYSYSTFGRKLVFRQYYRFESPKFADLQRL